MNRRDTVLVLLALGTAPFGALAQPVERAGKTLRVGILFVSTRAVNEAGIGTIFVDDMRELGWVEGRNVICDNVHADNDESRLPLLAAELVARGPDRTLISTTGASELLNSRPASCCRWSDSEANSPKTARSWDCKCASLLHLYGQPIYPDVRGSVSFAERSFIPPIVGQRERHL